MDEEPLPLNWKKHNSKSYPGKFYYYNHKTGETSWKHPLLLKAQEQSTNKNWKFCGFNLNSDNKNQKEELKIQSINSMSSVGSFKTKKRKMSSEQCDTDNNKKKKKSSLNDNVIKFQSKKEKKNETEISSQTKNSVIINFETAPHTSNCLKIQENSKNKNFKKKNSSINERLSKFRNEFKKHASNETNLMTNQKKKFSVNDRLQKLRQELQLKQRTKNNINAITNFSGQDSNKKSINKSKLGGYKIKKFSVNDRLKRLQEELQLKQIHSNNEKDVDMKDDSKNSSSSEKDSTVVNKELVFDESNTDTNYPIDKTSANSINELQSTPMDWEYIEQEIDRNIQEIRNESQYCSSQTTQTMADHYDVVDKNLLRLFAENNNTENDNTHDEKKIHFVIDTNVFLKELYFIKQLCNSECIKIIIPYAVLQELDSLKTRTNQAVSTLAVRAIRYLNDQYEAQNKKICGQSAIDAEEHIITITSADDSLINCCLQIKQKIDSVALLTNDINLRNKARSTGIKCVTSSEVQAN